MPLSQLRHQNAFDHRMEKVQYLIDINEDSLFDIVNDNNIPLGYIVDNHLSHYGVPDVSLQLKILEYLLRRAIWARKRYPTIGGLFHEIGGAEFVLNRLIDRLGKEEVWDCIHKVLTSIHFNDDEYPMIIHQTIKCTPQYMDTALTRFPDLLYNRNKENRLPLHTALEGGMEWSYDLLMLIQANQNDLKDCDPLTKLP